MPPAPVYPDGWTIGKPDVVFEMQEEYKVPAEGVIEYEYFYIPTNFTEAEVDSGDRAAARAIARSCTTRWRSTGPSPTCSARRSCGPNRDQMALPPPARAGHCGRSARMQTPGRLLATYAPGTNPQVLRPGTAIRLEPGGVIELQMHYTANGKAATDRTKIGLQSSPRIRRRREVRVTHFFNGTLILPAGSPDVARRCRHLVRERCDRLGHLPAHARSRKEVGVRPRAAGRHEEERPLGAAPTTSTGRPTTCSRSRCRCPKGSRLVSSAWYDNSPANKSNPDPKVDVKWGDQTWEEMQYTGLLFSPAASTPPPTQAGGPIR